MKTEKRRREMKSSNPVLSKAFNNQRGFAAMDVDDIRESRESDVSSLEQSYNSPAASSLRTGRMTIDDVVTRTGILFAILLVTGAFAWTANLGGGALLLGFGGGFILAMVISFSKKVRPALIMLYAAMEGLALGVLSNLYNSAYDGIVAQAVVATLAAIAGVLFAYKSGRIRVTAKFTKTLMAAVFGYLALGIASLIAGAFFSVGGGLGFFGLSGFGPMLAIAGVAIASFFLVLDFDQIEKGVRAGVPQEQSWVAGFGLMVTIVWLYMEVLRLISILRRD
jgi:uncharacterized YccA/Bax inhibitor family protein